jgi:hypothetical protein
LAQRLYRAGADAQQAAFAQFPVNNYFSLPCHVEVSSCVVDGAFPKLTGFWEKPGFLF